METYTPLIKFAVQMVFLIIINEVFRNLPFLKETFLPKVPINGASVVQAVIGMIIIGLLLSFRAQCKALLSHAFPDFPQCQPMVTAILNICVILVAYLMFKEIVSPFLYREEQGWDIRWLYPLIFFVFAMPHMYSLGTTLYKSADKVTDKIKTAIEKNRAELIECPKCGAKVKKDANFCPECGANLSEVLQKSRKY